MAKYHVKLFLEDAGHQAIIPPLFRRLVRDNNLDERDFDLLVLHSRGGKSLEAFKNFIAEARSFPSLTADLLLVASDANSAGFLARRKLISTIAEKSSFSCVIPIIPAPYIERWYLLDISALAAVTGCSIPQVSVLASGSKNHYKTVLRQVLADVSPPLGGIEYGEKIADVMDLYSVGKQVLRPSYPRPQNRQ